MSEEKRVIHTVAGTESPDSWEKIYQTGDAGWDIAKPAPPFVDLVNNPPEWLKPGKLLNWGCGGGHDANFFAENGFETTACDFAPSAIKQAQEYADKNDLLEVYLSDLLNIEEKYHNQFDYVLEHTCFCAIPIKNREGYVESALKVLKPGGILFGLFYRFDEPDEKGPPFYMSDDIVRENFEKDFEFIHWEIPKVSFGKRQNREKLIAMKRK